MEKKLTLNTYTKNTVSKKWMKKKLTLNTGDSLDDDWVTGLTLTGPACLKNWKQKLI